jgi:hypothetical protein
MQLVVNILLLHLQPEIKFDGESCRNGLTIRQGGTVSPMQKGILGSLREERMSA